MSSDRIEERVGQIEETLKELLNWIKFANRPLLKNLLVGELDSDEKKRVYELTNGDNSQSDIEAQTKVSRRMVGYYWQKWYSLGIVIASEQRKGRMQKIASLDEVGISISIADRDLNAESRPKYLKNILSNDRIFSDKNQLMAFAAPILKLDYAILEQNKDVLIDTIITAFEQSNRIDQSLFIQALQSKAKDLQSNEFNKFFQAWERQITR